jgi:uncharacterized protein (DUF58 family)
VSESSAGQHRGRADIRPSGAALRTGLLVVCGLIGLAVITGDVWLLLLACLAVGALVVDSIFPLPGACIHVGLQGPNRTRVGETITLRLTVSNAGTRESRPCVLRIRSPLLEVAPVHVTALQPGEQVVVDLPAVVVRRGAIQAVEVELVKGGILGLLTWSGVGTRRFEVVAAPPPVIPWDLPETGGTAPHPGGRPVVRPGGEEVHGVRDWRPGDPSRHVHWRATARRGRLVVADRFDEVGGDLVLVIAAPVGRPGLPDHAWEDVIARVAATAEATIAAGGAVALLASIAGVPDLMTRNPDAVLDWCARLPPADAMLPIGDEPAALERARRAAGPGGRELVVRTPAATALRAVTP